MEEAHDEKGPRQIESLKDATLEIPHRAGDLDLLDDDGNARRIPIPSKDPNDPLNFSKWRKVGILVCCCWFSIFSLVLVGGVGPIIPVFLGMYLPEGKTVEEIISLTTYPSVMMAAGAFIMLPSSMIIGRRPTFLACCFLLIGSTIGAARSNTFDTHMACRILQGIATGATESVLPLIITDVSFVDERGKWFAWYWGSQNLVNTIFTISVSYLVADLGWRWFYWLLAILAIVGTVGAFFLVPETRYQRSPMSVNGHVVHTDEFGVTTVVSSAEARDRLGHGSLDASNSVPKPKSYMKQLEVFSGMPPNALRVGAGALLKMLQSCSSPAIIWAVLASSISLGTGIAMSLTYGTVLTGQFGWDQSQVGLVNAGIFPAAIGAMIYAGWLGDRMTIFFARRNGGVHIPEHTLIILIFPALVSLVGIVIYGAAANWPHRVSDWGIIMGWTLFEFGFIVVLMTTSHFASEAVPESPGPALALVIGLKNVVSFGASYGITPMVHMYNYMTAYMILFGIFAAISLLGLPIYFLNPKWRARLGKKS